MEHSVGELVWQASEHHAHSLLDMTWADFFNRNSNRKKGIYFGKKYKLHFGVRAGERVDEFFEKEQTTLILIRHEKNFLMNHFVF
jgi:ABC-type lipoprotein release transport system permease subunit